MRALSLFVCKLALATRSMTWQCLARLGLFQNCSKVVGCILVILRAVLLLC